MKINKKFLLALTLSFLLSATVAYAASSGDFLTKALKYIDSNCARSKISNETSLNCYLFYKIGELGTQADSNTSRVSALENQVEGLETRVFLLENPPSPSPSPSPLPEISQLYDFNQAFIVPPGYNTMIIEIQDAINFPWAPNPSFDNGNTYIEQHRYNSGISNARIPVLSDKYRIESGAPTSVQVRIRLISDPKADLINFGSNLSYPFTSQIYDFTGYTHLWFTTSGGSINAVVFQQEVSPGVFGEIQRNTCDGGSECPAGSFGIATDGNFRLLIEGSGSGTLFNGLLIKP